MSMTAAIAIVAFVAADVPKDAKEAFQGGWKLTRFAKLRRETPAKELEKGKVVIQGDNLIFTLAGQNTKMTYSLDPKADPPAIDLKSENAPGKVIRGIYKLEKDKLTICFGIEDSARPTEFKTGRDDSIMVLERAKK
jgi:uncharacterized protein (TIGR03067 family)